MLFRSRAAADRAAAEVSLDRLCALPISAARTFLSALVLDGTQEVIATELLKEIRGRLEFLDRVGLGYLALDRRAPTLSGGESQRIRLATQIGAGLTGVLYVLDEPSIGLHPRDNVKLLGALEALRDKGNTVVVVEHNPHVGWPPHWREIWGGRWFGDDPAYRHVSVARPLFDAEVNILGSLNVASKEWVIRQYDHEVQAGSVVKPLVGVCNDGPSDAAVVRPNLKTKRGLAIACGMNPRFGDLDPYWMAASAIDEAVRFLEGAVTRTDRIQKYLANHPKYRMAEQYAE